jgi:hypothetical protein
METPIRRTFTKGGLAMPEIHVDPDSIRYIQSWEEVTDTCPKCNGRTEVLIETRHGIDYEEAERCPRCKWQINFDDL